MGLAIVTAFALSFWIIWGSLGRSSFDGFLVAMIIICVAAGLRALKRPGSSDALDG